MRSALVLAVVLMAAACTDGAAQSTTSLAAPAAPPTSRAAGPTTVGTGPEVSLPACLHGDAGEQPAGVGSSGGDGTAVAGVTLVRLGDEAVWCERLTIDLAAAAGAPATTVGITAVRLGPSVVRLAMPPAVTATGLANVTLGGALVDRVFVVLAEDGGLGVDVHLGAAAGVRVFAFDSPARLVVDAQPDDGEPPARPTYGRDAVVLAPDPGTVVYPVLVEGYVRTNQPTAVVALVSASGERFEVPVAGRAHPWQSFRAEFASGPSGSLRIEVGDVQVPLVTP